MAGKAELEANLQDETRPDWFLHDLAASLLSSTEIAELSHDVGKRILAKHDAPKLVALLESMLRHSKGEISKAELQAGIDEAWALYREFEFIDPAKANLANICATLAAGEWRWGMRFACSVDAGEARSQRAKLLEIAKRTTVKKKAEK